MSEVEVEEVMSPEEQWTEISYSRDYLIAVLDLIKDVMASMKSKKAYAENVRTEVNGVPISYSYTEDSNFILINIGTDKEGKPQVPMYIPVRWVTEV